MAPHPPYPYPPPLQAPALAMAMAELSTEQWRAEAGALDSGSLGGHHSVVLGAPGLDEAALLLRAADAAYAGETQRPAGLQLLAGAPGLGWASDRVVTNPLLATNLCPSLSRVVTYP